MIQPVALEQKLDPARIARAFGIAGQAIPKRCIQTSFERGHLFAKDGKGYLSFVCAQEDADLRLESLTFPIGTYGGPAYSFPLSLVRNLSHLPRAQVSISQEGGEAIWLFSNETQQLRIPLTPDVAPDPFPHPSWARATTGPEVRQKLIQANACVATESPRYTLTAMHVTEGWIEACNSYAAIQVEHTWQADPFSILIPRPIINLLRYLPDEPIHLVIPPSPEDERGWIGGETWEIGFLASHEKYPNLDSLYPPLSSLTFTFSIKAASLVEIARDIEKLSPPKAYPTILFNLQEDGTLRLKNRDGSLEVTLSGQSTGHAISFRLSTKLVRNILQSIPPNHTILLGGTHPYNPIIFVTSDPNLRAVCMPVTGGTA